MIAKEGKYLVKLPGVDRAVVDRSKIRDYLLSESHAVGRFKASFFTALGYSAEGWEILATDLSHHAVENDALATEANSYGQKYEVRGILRGPANRKAVLSAVWIVLTGEDFPRLVTAFPGPRS